MLLIIYPKIKRNPTLVVGSPCFRNTPVFFVQPEHQVTQELLVPLGHFFISVLQTEARWIRGAGTSALLAVDPLS